jgi:pyridoxine 4-dehydrogenase
MPGTNGAIAADAGTVDIGGDVTVNRLGFGAMRITGRGIWGEPADATRPGAGLRRRLSGLLDAMDRQLQRALPGVAG